MTNLGPGGAKSFARKFTPMNRNLNSWQSGIRFRTHWYCTVLPHWFLIMALSPGVIHFSLTELSWLYPNSPAGGPVANSREVPITLKPTCMAPPGVAGAQRPSPGSTPECPNTTSSVPKCWCLPVQMHDSFPCEMQNKALNWWLNKV